MSRPSLFAAVHDAVTPPTSDECAHPFSNSYSRTVMRLKNILNTTAQLSQGLAQLSTLPSSDQTSKLVSLMKQHTAISASIEHSRAATLTRSSADRRAVFPDTAPPSPTRLEEWGRAQGMETFIDSSGVSSTTTVVLAGKVLVLDVDIDGGVVVKTSFAVGNNIAIGTPVIPELDAFLARDIARWVEAARRASLAAVYYPQAEDPSIEAAHHALAVQDHLRYLMMLDSLAVAEGEHGIRWFMEPDSIAQHFINAQRSTGDWDRPKSQPLDKMLTQHALPLPYLNTPSLSLLVWLSPLTYLRLLRSSPEGEKPRTYTGPTDVSNAHITSVLSKDSDGATIASLKLVPSSEVFGVSSLPDFPNDHIFPDLPSHTWVLEFNRPSRSRTYSAKDGVVISQSRMRAIQDAIGADIDTDALMNISAQPGPSAGTGLGNMGSFGSVGLVSGMSMGQLGFNGFMMGPPHSQSIGHNGGGSWVDLLINEGLPVEYYKATQKSPSGAHPPLNLRLAAPQEPGFVLQKVPVKSANQVSCVLEIVREQCWLNELLGMLQWQPDGISPPSQGQTASSVQPTTTSGQEGEGSVSVELLTSVLAGTVTPQSIPVSVYLPSTILPPLAQTNLSASHFGLEGLGVGPPPVSGGSSAGSLFGSTDIDMEMEMEIPGLSMSMNPGINISMAGMGIELTSSPVSSRPPPMIVLSSPARAPAAGLVELRVSFGEGNVRSGNTSPDCGVKVESMPRVDTHGMDEVVRRGGIWGLPGRVWATQGYKQ
ncbi:hypothetical protein PAXRUDRAFT_823625 [Paxillus rubicundulus Ve08.2h10]|uniref:Uncharacterized protein n=1 Tax=Paxillus rubicundulus Ve08.2h10 TaxID=930991 RepID=A0A0D0DVB2_9AGAM|nr:hypothetical protein PAXRUDRAFT_823625 [Paxillus rubicundulus Ve08.2h10]